MNSTRSGRYRRARDYLRAAVDDVEHLAIHAPSIERLALEMAADDARRSLGALERTLALGLATLDDRSSGPRS